MKFEISSLYRGRQKIYRRKASSGHDRHIALDRILNFAPDLAGGLQPCHHRRRQAQRLLKKREAAA